MTLPRWLSLVGWAEHAVVGLGITALFAPLGVAPPVIVVITLLVAAVHEEAPRDNGLIFADFQPRFSGPINGICDVLAFLPAPLIWWGLRG